MNENSKYEKQETCDVEAVKKACRDSLCYKGKHKVHTIKIMSLYKRKEWIIYISMTHYRYEIIRACFKNYSFLHDYSYISIVREKNTESNLQTVGKRMLTMMAVFLFIKTPAGSIITY